MRCLDVQMFESIIKNAQEKFPKLQGEFFSIHSPTTTLKFIDEVDKLGLSKEYFKLKEFYDRHRGIIESSHFTCANSFIQMSLFWTSNSHKFTTNNIIDNFIDDLLYYNRINKNRNLNIDFTSILNFSRIVSIGKLEQMTISELDEFFDGHGFKIDLTSISDLNGSENFGEIIHCNDFRDKMILSKIIDKVNSINHDVLVDKIQNRFIRRTCRPQLMEDMNSHYNNVWMDL